MSQNSLSDVMQSGNDDQASPVTADDSLSSNAGDGVLSDELDDNILPIITDDEWPIPLYTGDIEEDLRRFDSLADADYIFGKLSTTGKMPGPSFNLPASACPTGSRLREVPGSPCSTCYAADSFKWLKQSAKNTGTRYKLNNFAGKDVRRANALRLHRLRDRLWVPAMVYAMLHGEGGFGVGWMRWMSSGDVQSLNHLKNILLVAQYTPETSHWLPTMERKWVQQVSPPSNLVIRVSGARIDGVIPNGIDFTSTISTALHPSHGGFRCPAATNQEYACGTCRACWEPEVTHIEYYQKQLIPKV